jgi:hypothetical protein
MNNIFSLIFQIIPYPQNNFFEIWQFLIVDSDYSLIKMSELCAAINGWKDTFYIFQIIYQN